MKNLQTFEEFINESINAPYKGKPVVETLSDGTKVEIYRNNILEDDNDDSLGVKSNFVENLNTWNGDKSTRYTLYKILTGPNKGSLLFCETLFTKIGIGDSKSTKYGHSVDKTKNWYSENPKTYSFKDVKIDATNIPPILKMKYDEFVEILNKY